MTAASTSGSTSRAWSGRLAGDASVADARNAIDQFGLASATIQELQSDEGVELRIEPEPVSANTSDQVTDALAKATRSSADDVSLTSVGPSWGGRSATRRSAR